MLAVDLGKVKKSCWIALVQTTVRDMAAIGALTAGLIIEPWGMIATLGIVVAAVMLTRRSRFFLALIFLGVVCVALALVNGNRSERISLGIPLACLALCLLVYLADVWLAMCYVRRIWRKSARQATDNTSPEARRSMRLRIKGLIGILAPVAEIIGSVAALEAICQHL